MASMHTLLNWAIENTANGENDGQQPRAPPRPIDKEILEIITDSDASKMSKLVKIISDQEAPLELREVALGSLEYFVQIIDNANDLLHETVNGLTPVLESLKSEHDGIRMRAAWVLATCVSNNPSFQKVLIDKGGLEILVDALKKEHHIGSLTKIIYAISSLLGHNAPALNFRKLGGFEHLAAVLSMSEEKINEAQQLHEKQREKEIATMKDIDYVPEPIVDPNIPVLESIEDSLKKSAHFLQKDKKEGTIAENAKEQWSKAVHKIVFLFLKLARENEQLKLSYVKDANGFVLKSILSVLTREDLNDMALKEDVLQTIFAVLTSANPTMENYVKDIVKKNFPSLKDLKSTLKGCNDPEAERLVQEITEKLS